MSAMPGTGGCKNVGWIDRLGFGVGVGIGIGMRGEMEGGNVHHAAPPPTAGPLSARMRTFLWSIIERRSSVAAWYLLSVQSHPVHMHPNLSSLLLNIDTRQEQDSKQKGITHHTKTAPKTPTSSPQDSYDSQAAHSTQPTLHNAKTHTNQSPSNQGHTHTALISVIPFTSAPAEKKRPSPVSTVKMVSGCESRTRRAAMVSGWGGVSGVLDERGGDEGGERKGWGWE